MLADDSGRLKAGPRAADWAVRSAAEMAAPRVSWRAVGWAAPREGLLVAATADLKALVMDARKASIAAAEWVGWRVTKSAGDLAD